MLKAGTYNDVVRENLPPQHRTGTIRRRDFWNVWPDARVDFFKDISPADVAEFIERASAQEENYAAMKDRLQAMTANDFSAFVPWATRRTSMMAAENAEGAVCAPCRRPGRGIAGYRCGQP